MAVQKVYGSLDSLATLRVLACLYELDLDFEFVPINLEAGEHKKKSFLSMSPFGQVPVYEDRDVKHFESGAIIRCTAHEYFKEGKQLIEWDARKQAVVANWVDVEDHKFEPAALKLITEIVIKPKNGLAPDEGVMNEAKTELGKVVDVYEARLSKSKYLASDKYSIADLVHLPILHQLMGTEANKIIHGRPHVSAWCSQILARPAWLKVFQMLPN